MLFISLFVYRGCLPVGNCAPMASWTAKTTLDWAYTAASLPCARGVAIRWPCIAHVSMLIAELGEQASWDSRTKLGSQAQQVVET